MDLNKEQGQKALKSPSRLGTSAMDTVMERLTSSRKAIEEHAMDARVQGTLSMGPPSRRCATVA